MDLSDVQITTKMLMPILIAIKDNFMFMLPALLTVFALKLGAWLIPLLLNQVTKK